MSCDDYVRQSELVALVRYIEESDLPLHGARLSYCQRVILLRGFGRLDVFPPGDVGARRTLARLLGRSTPLSAQEETALLERLGPYRGLLYFVGLAWSRGMLSGG